MPQAPVTRHIRATPDNAAALRALVQRWPELHALVQQLQADRLFPGLRSLQISLTGAPQWVAQGLGAPWPPNPPQAVQAEPPCFNGLRAMREHPNNR